MPIGIVINTLSIFLGGIIGALLGGKLPEKLKDQLPLIFGLASMGMGLINIVKINILPAVILALILGSALGILINLEGLVEKLAKYGQASFTKLMVKYNSNKNSTSKLEADQNEFMEQFVAIIILFCASSSGIYGSLVEGMTGDPTMLLTKSILDFFTAALFAATMGYLVATIAIPQFIVCITLFLSAGFIIPLASPEMIADFSACGGLILLATGFRISNVKYFPTANMLPALVLVMPISYLWTAFML